MRIKEVGIRSSASAGSHSEVAPVSVINEGIIRRGNGHFVGQSIIGRLAFQISERKLQLLPSY
jgi:hypothetical protein